MIEKAAKEKRAREKILKKIKRRIRGNEKVKKYTETTGEASEEIKEIIKKINEEVEERGAKGISTIEKITKEIIAKERRARARRAKGIRIETEKRIGKEETILYNNNDNLQKSDFLGICMGIRIPINKGKNGDSVIINDHDNGENSHYKKMVLENRDVFVKNIDIKKAIDSINVDFDKLFPQ